MAIKDDNLSASSSLRKTRTFGKVRCHNPSCMERIQPEPGAKHAKCPICGMEYRLFWVNPKLPRIRGPVWDVNREIAQKKMANIEASKKPSEKGGK